MHSNQTVSGTQRGRRVRGRLLSVTAVAIAVAATAALATAAPAAADPTASQTAGLGVRVIGTVTVDPSHVGVIVAVPGSGGPLKAQAFRLWQNGRPQAVRVDPLPASALRIAVVVDAGPGAQLQGAQNAVADLMIGLPNGAEAAVVGAAGPHRPATDRRRRFGRAGARGCDPLGPARRCVGADTRRPRGPPGAPGATRRRPHHDHPGPRRAGERRVRAASCRRCQPVRRGRAGNRAVARPARRRKRRLGGHRIIRPLAHASRGCDRCRSRPPVPARVRHDFAGADRDPSPGGGGRRGDDRNRRSDRAGAGLVRLARSASAKPRRRARECWCVCGLADRRGVAVVPGRRGDRRSTAAMA